MYTKPKLSTEIIQGSIYDITPELLLEKQPVVMYDKIVNLQDVIDSTFKYLFTFFKKHTVLKNNIYQSNSRFALIHNTTEEDLIIHIVKSRKKHNHLNAFYSCLTKDVYDESKQIQIMLKPHNVISIPYLYMFTSSEQITITFLNDVIHIISP